MEYKYEYGRKLCEEDYIDGSIETVGDEYEHEHRYLHTRSLNGAIFPLYDMKRNLMAMKLDVYPYRRKYQSDTMLLSLSAM